MSFSKDFVWGAASSAYQTEGYPTADGGGQSVWDTFCQRPGAIAGNTDGSVACDAYHRYEEDIRLMHELGMKAYRFSISWSRVDPQGDGNFNQNGIDYYHRIVDCCQENGIIPYITLHHWELPQSLESQGGWLNPLTPYAFSRYAARIARDFNKQVKYFITINEPQCILHLGHHLGLHAPGKDLSQEDLFTCFKHLALAHGLAEAEIKAVNPDAQVGIATTGRLCYPATESSDDIEASRKATFELFDDDWLFAHHLFLDPVCLGQFPDCPGTKLETLAENEISPEEWENIHQIPDFIALNVYNGCAVKKGSNGQPEYVERPLGHPTTALKWPITEPVMHYPLIYIYERYHLPIYISENGLSCNDKIYLDGKVHDPDRIDFLTRYLRELSKACDTADIRGYFHWSLTDNFEWHSGYSERFGLIYIDYPTLKRIPKDSAYWYKELIRSNGTDL